MVERFLGQFGNAGERADHAGRLHRHHHELLVRRLGQRLERLDVLLRDKVVDRLHVAAGDRVGHRLGRRGFGFGQALARLGLAERGFLVALGLQDRSEEHTSELQSLMRISYAVFCLKKKKKIKHQKTYNTYNVTYNTQYKNRTE